jgi:hypothetical protein
VVASSLAFSSYLFSGQRPKSTFYRDGDTIKTPYGDVEIRDWKLIFTPNSGAKDYMISAVVPSADWTSLIRDFGCFENCVKYDGSYMLTAFPSDLSGMVSLVAVNLTDNTRVSYDIKLNFRAYPSLKPSIFTELRVKEDVLERLHTMRNIFGLFCREPRLYVLNVDGKYRELKNSDNDQYTTNAILLSSRLFDSPEYAGQDEQYPFHEFSHCLGRIMEADKDFRAKFYQAYNELARRAGIRLKNLKENIDVSCCDAYSDTPSPEKDPRFSLFDESRYINANTGKDFDFVGHPFHNPRELLASGLTVFRFYAQEFAQGYGNLNSDNRELVREVGLAIFALLDKLNPKAVPQLLPEHKMLRELFAGR